MSTRVLQGDCRHLMRNELNACSVDAVVTDPPYELNFMGREWDRSGVAFDPATWAQALRVLKPGGHLLAFGGSRTFHRIAVAIEDAGFEIRDTIFWCYGSGFPKSLDVSKAIDKAAGVEREVVGVHRRHGGGQAVSGSMSGPLGTVSDLPLTAPATPDASQWAGWGTALKPAVEPVIMARKPLSERTVAANVQRWGTGALNIDGCRVPGLKPDTTRGAGGQHGRDSEIGAQGRIVDDGLGRWPANLIHDGSDEVVAGFPLTISGGGPKEGTPRSKVHTYGEPTVSMSRRLGTNSGSAARFFYCAKAGKADRAGSKHPTVKPQSLMRYLCRLVTPPSGTVLDPFAGSGSTLQAARDEGFSAIGVEISPEFVADCERRLRETVATLEVRP